MLRSIPFVSGSVPADLLSSEHSEIESNRDLLAIQLFGAIGLALTIGFALLFPIAANEAALLWTVG